MNNNMAHHLPGTLLGSVFALSFPAQGMTDFILLAVIGGAVGFITTTLCKAIWVYLIKKFKK